MAAGRKGSFKLLNAWANAYIDAATAVEKRHALTRYLEWLVVYLGAEDCEADPKAALGKARELFNKRPLRELEVHLSELDNGESPEIFRPATKKTGRRPSSRKDQMWFASASALVTILIRDFHKSEDEAARKTVEALKIRGLPTPGTSRAVGPTWKALQSWRDQLMAGKKGKLARAWYDETMMFGPGETEGQTINIHLDPSRLPFDPLGLD